MPELPEVQTIVSDLNKKILQHTITDVWFDAPKLIKYPKPEKFKKEIKGNRIIEIKRRAKNILILLKNEKGEEKTLLIHLKMTGHLLLGKWEVKKGKIISLNNNELNDKVNGYIHFIFYLSSGSGREAKDGQLAFSDVRKFGKIMLAPKGVIENLPAFKKLGPEPLDPSFTFEVFKNATKNQNKTIKQTLLDQNIIAGIGNIYADEILWTAKILPSRKTQSLKDEEIKSIYKAIKKILALGVKLRGASISDYRDTEGRPGNYLKKRLVYKRTGLPCLRCKNPIKKTKIAGRGTHFCEICQK